MKIVNNMIEYWNISPKPHHQYSQYSAKHNSRPPLFPSPFNTASKLLGSSITYKNYLYFDFACYPSHADGRVKHISVI